MPDTPLKTFRAVEPANWGFGATATIASQPFVLYHARNTPQNASTSATTALTGPANTNVLAASRFQPWTSKTLSTHYPVAVPNAYDRVYIFPMYVVETTNGTDTATPIANQVATTFSIASPGTSYAAPLIMPFGRLAQSRDNALVPDTLRRLPYDLIRRANPNAVTLDGYNQGIWTALPSYASNFLTSNGLATTVGTFGAPVSTPRTTASGLGIGAGYQLPPDLGVGIAAGANAVSNTASDFAATTGSGTATVIGAGLEFSLMGCEELVVNPLTVPANFPTVTLSTQTGQTGSVGSGALNWFLMGVFLG